MTIRTMILGLVMGVASTGAQAVQVYRYEFGTRPDGSTLIEFVEPEGIGGLESVFDLSLLGRAPFPADGFGNPLPAIAEREFGLEDVLDFRGAFEWDAQSLFGFWTLEFVFADGIGMSVDSASVQTFYPLEYFPNESAESSNWFFAGVRETCQPERVPDAGSTLGLLALALGGLGFMRKR